MTKKEIQNKIEELEINISVFNTKLDELKKQLETDKPEIDSICKFRKNDGITAYIGWYVESNKFDDKVVSYSGIWKSKSEVYSRWLIN